MEYIIKQTIEVMTTIEADSREDAIKMLDNLDIDEADQITIMDTEIESIEEYEESFNETPHEFNTEGKFTIEA
jgi:protein-tyrosine-phosphatase